MATNEQKELWRKEKEQMLRDKQNQPREVRKRPVSLILGGPQKKSKPTNPVAPLEDIPDDVLRRRLGI